MASVGSPGRDLAILVAGKSALFLPALYRANYNVNLRQKRLHLLTYLYKGSVYALLAAAEGIL